MRVSGTLQLRSVLLHLIGALPELRHFCSRDPDLYSPNICLSFLC